MRLSVRDWARHDLWVDVASAWMLQRDCQQDDAQFGPDFSWWKGWNDLAKVIASMNVPPSCGVVGSVVRLWSL